MLARHNHRHDLEKIVRRRNGFFLLLLSLFFEELTVVLERAAAALLVKTSLLCLPLSMVAVLPLGPLNPLKLPDVTLLFALKLLSAVEVRL